MSYTFTCKFESATDAIRGLVEASSTISELINISKYEESEFNDYTRMTAIQNLASHIVDNPPDLNNESYPQVPSFNVNAYNFFFRSDKNIGFGVNYNRDENCWIATICLYLNARLFRTNSCAKFLQSSEMWELMPYVPKRNRRKNTENVDEINNVDEDREVEEYTDSE